MLNRFPVAFIACFGLLIVGILSSPVSTDARPAELGGLSIGDVTNALQIGWLEHIDVFLTQTSLQKNLVDVDLTVKNPLIVEFTVESISAKGGLNGTNYLAIDNKFNSPVVVPSLAEKTLTRIIDGFLNQTQIGLLVETGTLDVQADIVVRAGTINGIGGIRLSINGLKQSGISTA
ncbi:hypothetical protein Moror_3394 [Moniliophthora roreri MCA 2997]|uniref:Late embryogenesis abundant protein LEA-2 subgroup domain-containing protein n=2 Tax=Moniliophthora roreri TaxID=221103 RepID=V2WJ81_MONRO|nr:hypothetical protein Moror_3394 [Moniliophthora roreri MCA 2997]